MIFKNGFYFIFIFGSIWLSVNSSPKKYIISPEQEDEVKKIDDFSIRVLIYSNDENFEKNLDVSSLNENNTIDINLDIDFIENYIQMLIIKIFIGNDNFNKNMKSKQIYSKDFKPDEILLKSLSILTDLNNHRNQRIKVNNLNNILDLINFNINPEQNKIKKEKISKRVLIQLKHLLDLLNFEMELLKISNESTLQNLQLTTQHGQLKSTQSYKSFQNSTNSATDLKKNSTQTTIGVTISSTSNVFLNTNNHTNSIHIETSTLHTLNNTSYPTLTKDLNINLTNWLDEQLKSDNQLTNKIAESTHFSTTHPVTAIHSFIPEATTSNVVDEDESDTDAFFKKRGNLISI